MPSNERDLLSAVLAELASDGDIIRLSGDTVAGPRVFEARDRRRLPSTTYPYAVLVHVAGRYDDLNGRGDVLRDVYYDLHWFHNDGAVARELVSYSVKRLRRSQAEEMLDTAEGRCKACIPGSTRAHVDPRFAEGVSGEADIIDAFVQLHFVIAENIG